MARITFVKKARKNQGPCCGCGELIMKGDSYKWFANRIGRSSYRKNFHSGCTIKRSDQTTSDKLGQLYDAQDQASDDIAAWEDEIDTSDLTAALEQCAEVAQDVASQYEESAQNIEDGFGHPTYQSEEIQEKAAECEAWAETLTSVQFEDFEYNPEAEDSEDEQRAIWREEQQGLANDAVNELPL